MDSINITLSTLADWIIVICFFSLIGCAIGHGLGRLICWIVEKNMDRREKRRQDKEMEAKETE